MIKEKKRKVDLFLASLMLISFFALNCILLVVGKGEADIGNGLIANFLADHTEYIFPFVLLTDFKVLDRPIFLLLFFLSNILVYATIMAILFDKIINFSWYKPFLATYWTIVVIVIFLILSFVCAIIEAA